MSRITVFERPDATSIFVEWWDDTGRHKQSLATAAGPVTDRDLAMQIAERMSRAQEMARNKSTAEMLGLPSPRTLHELLKALHMAKGADWSDAYKRDQNRYRALWEEKLGDVRLTAVNASLVERVARDAYPKKLASRRHALRYIVDAFYYADLKLKWIDPRHNLSAVTLPKARSESLPYSLEEARKLLPALEGVDWRAAWIAHVALQTGRRLTAIRTLPNRKRWAELKDGYAVLRFPGDTDKARNTGEAVVTGDALRLTCRAVEGYRVPTLEECRDWLDAAEKKAKVPHKKGRGWHAFKRLYATLAKGYVGREKQSGTTGQTLDRVYVQDELGPKLELAKILAARMGGK